MSKKANRKNNLEDSSREMQQLLNQQQDVKKHYSENEYYTSILSLKSALSNSIEQMMIWSNEHSNPHSLIEYDIIFESLYWMLQSIDHMDGVTNTNKLLISKNGNNDKDDDIFTKVFDVCTAALCHNKYDSKDDRATAKSYRKNSHVAKKMMTLFKKKSTVQIPSTERNIAWLHDCTYQMLDYTRLLLLKQSLLFAEETESKDESTDAVFFVPLSQGYGTHYVTVWV